MTPEQTAQVRALNDAMRTDPHGDIGRTVITAAASNMGLVFTLKLLRAARAFTAFTPDNDPHQEHDMAIFTVEGETCFFKVDVYLNGEMEYGADEPWNPDNSYRVMTLGLMSDY